ncbi:Mur ligase family protein [Flammeovirgaceae bacterium SG7u.111]|nr:Mur ligase family protein [Flammeovirgaceae bacterium SG7u.132]WPO33268.1 Mur ligase family protein [Flammeovirgaceae bacterium SG7u.111]
MKVHFIAIGGSVMHDLAIALKSRGYEVTGSDDEIFDPSYTKLKNHGLLPEVMGWDASKITDDLDAVILGMHAREDNPEYIKARELGLNIYSFPAYVHEQAKNKQRIVVGGSHGKTTVTAMIVHVLNYFKRNPDYLLGAVPKGLTDTIKLTEKAPVIILEGDEYPSAAIDLKPKFINYQQHIGVITGISWDHVNVYPSYDSYVEQFRAFAEASCKAGTLIYCEDDPEVKKLIKSIEFPEDVSVMPYTKHPYKIINGQTYLIDKKNKKEIPVKVFGEHNMMNLSAAKEVVLKMRITEDEFYEAISSFEGTKNRLNLLAEGGSTKVFKDFAHAPSKLKATVEAVKSQFGKQKLVACMELHTYSSLNKKFLPNYKNSIKSADVPVVYFNPATVSHKRLEPITPGMVTEAFGQELNVFTDSAELEAFLRKQDWNNTNLLMMSSGNFNNMDVEKLAQEIVK